MGRSVAAVGAGAALAWTLGKLAGWLLWPRVFEAGLLDLQRPTGRLIFMVVGVIPVLLGGYVAGRLAPRRPLRHGLAVGVLLLVPLLLDLPRLLRAYDAVPQPLWPLWVTIALRPLGGMAGAYLTGRVESPGPAATTAA